MILATAESAEGGDKLVGTFMGRLEKRGVVRDVGWL